MAIKTYKCTFEINWDASHIESVEVKANTERKAWKFAENALRHKYGYKDDIIVPFIPIKIEKIDC